MATFNYQGQVIDQKSDKIIQNVTVTLFIKKGIRNVPIKSVKVNIDGVFRMSIYDEFIPAGTKATFEVKDQRGKILPNEVVLTLKASANFIPIKIPVILPVQEEKPEENFILELKVESETALEWTSLLADCNELIGQNTNRISAVKLSPKGVATFQFITKDLKKQGGNPDIYFRVYSENKVFYDGKEKGEIFTNQPPGKHSYEIFLKNKVEKSEFFVSGTVMNLGIGTHKKITVQVFDVDLLGAAKYKSVSSVRDFSAIQGIEFLGGSSINKNGAYEVGFSSDSFQKNERGLADVVAYAILDNVVVGRSRLAFKKEYTSENRLDGLDIVLEESSQSQTEFSLIYPAAKAYVDEAKLTLEAILSSEDQLILVAEEIDWPLAYVVTLSMGSKLISDSKAESLVLELFYGLGRQGVELDWQILYDTSEEVLKDAIIKSQSDRIIKAFSEKEVNDFLESLKLTASSEVLKSKGNESNLVNEFLSLSLQKESDRIAFVKASKQYSGTDENDFWNTFLPAQTGLKSDAIARIKTTQVLFSLSGSFLPAVNQMVNTGVKDPAEFVKWDFKTWKELVEKSGFPEEIEGGDQNEKAENYAKFLQDSMNIEFTTQAVLHKVSNQEISIANSKVKKAISKFLGTESDFDLKFSPIDDFKDKIGDKEAVVELKSLQRMVRINPDTSLIPILKERNLDSAIRITEFSPKVFLKVFADDFGGVNKAKLVYEKASLIQAKVDLAEAGIHNYSNEPFLKWIKDPGEIEVTRNFLKEKFPGYSKIFEANGCECNHCESVYSPSAYFVDLMRFLQKGSLNTQGENPSEVFRKRRPDLFHLPLTCQNSNTLIPYLDLVNEVLENYVFYTIIDGEEGAYLQFRSHDIAGATEEELRAQAQYIRKETYRELAENAIYPSSLPFNLPLGIIHSYIEQLGSDWYDILNITAPFSSNEHSSKFLSSAILKFSESDYAAVSRKDYLGGIEHVHAYWEYFGFGTESDLRNKLSAVPELLSRTGLKYLELISLVQSRFINPGIQKFASLESIVKEVERLDGKLVYAAIQNFHSSGTTLPSEISVVLSEKGIELEYFSNWLDRNFEKVKQTITLHEENSSCDLLSTQLKSIENLFESPIFKWNEKLCLKIYSFLKLWRTIGWSMDQLDTVLHGLSIDTFDEDSLGLLASAKRFIDFTNSEPKQAAVLWGEMGTWYQSGLYQELFLSKDIQVSPVFSSLGGSFKVNEDEEKGLAVLIPDIQSALGISESDLILIFENESIDIPTEEVSLQTISLAYRYDWFAKLCGVTIIQLLDIIQTFELEPFSNPENSLVAFKRIKAVQGSNFTIDDLNFLINGIVLEEISYEQLINQLLDENERIDHLNLEGVSSEDLASTRLGLKRSFTLNLLANHFSVSSEVIQSLVGAEIEALVSSIDVGTWIDLLIQLERASKAILGFDFTEEEAQFFVENGDQFGGLDILNLTPSHWCLLHDYVSFREKLPRNLSSPVSFLDYFISNPSATVEDLVQKVLEVTAWKENDVLFLFTAISGRGGEDLLQRLMEMQHIIQLSNQMGVLAKSLVEMVPTDWTFDELWEKSLLCKRLIKSKYNKKSWSTVASKLNNELREKQRDALVSYLLSTDAIKSSGIDHADGLYEHFLIDVQMGACMDTSRIVQASAAIQQFVNRIHLNLEKEIAQDALDRDRWNWMKNYRVWEAQMRILYENPIYLNPEWRTNKSEFFEELESHLTQNDITDRTAEEALRGYLNNMKDVANLNVAGMYEEKDGTETKVIHVFGHTHHTPYKYFYRKYLKKHEKWTPWTKVDAAIQPVINTEGGGESGVHLIPVVWKNRLLLFWPEFIEKAINNMDSNKVISSSSQINLDKPKKYWEIRLAWSEYYNDKWTAKKSTSVFCTVFEMDSGKSFLNNLSFSIKINDSKLQIFVNKNEGFKNLGIDQICFEFESIEGLVKVFQSALILPNGGAKYFDYGNPIKKIKKTIGFKFIASNNEFENSFMTLSKVGKLEKNHVFLGANNRFNLLFSGDLNSPDITKNPAFFSSRDKVYYIENKPLIYNSPISIPVGNNQLFLQGNHSVFPLGFRPASPAQIVQPKLNFSSFHHPFVSDFVSNLNKNGIGTGKSSNPGLMDSDTLEFNEEGKKYDDGGATFERTFQPKYQNVSKPSDLSESHRTYFKNTIDFESKGANSIYNWELFFHTPLYIATQLSKNGKFEEALKWFHYIFDPTTDELPTRGLEEVSRFWKVKPFKYEKGDSFQDFINNLGSNSGVENPIISEWRENPFEPHLIAANYPVNYKKYTLLSYVENLVEWADSKFRKFTRENVYEAIQLYVLASQILGPKPEFIPARGKKKKETFESLNLKLNDLSNARVELENSLGYSSGFHDLDDVESSSLSGTGLALYFCITPNDKLLKYWDIVEDRLYKIRNCKDIEGVARRLALFAPRIDPGLLVKAKSAGLDLDTILLELNVATPHHRFAFLLQKANEFCNDVKSLGSSLLSAIEKYDGEKLSQLRSTHEIGLLNLTEGIKERQVLDAKLTVEQLTKQREAAIARFEYYNETLLGNEPVSIPSIIPLSADLNEESQVSVNPTIQKIVTDVNVSLVDGSERGLKIIPKEREDLDLRLAATILSTVAGTTKMAASIAALFPNLNSKFQPFGVGVDAGFGGQNIAFGLQNISEASQIISSTLSQTAAIASTGANYIRREQEWTNQANLVIREIENLELQILSAGIRLQVAEKDLENHKKQIENAEAIEIYIKEKFSNKELYSWMKDQLISLHKQSFDLAFELAKKAEAALKFEKRGTRDLLIIDYSYWDNARSGLLAGEKLQLALRRLETEYLERNTRVFELTKHVSLKRLNPIELLKLQETGVAHFALAEELFDLDYPGHFNRTIKSVSLSIPCISGPYTSIPCTLRLGVNKKRIDTSLEVGYKERNLESSSDERFISQNIPVSSIATSSAQNDSGVYELNFRDERYVPFEGAGVISEWDIELFHDTNSSDFGKSLRQFDYSTISDLILHINYIAEEDFSLKNAAIENVKYHFSTIEDAWFFKSIDIKRDYPNDWNRYLNSGLDGLLSINLNSYQFSYLDQNKVLNISELTLLIETDQSLPFSINLRSNSSNTLLDGVTNTLPDFGSLQVLQSETLSSVQFDFSSDQIIEWSFELSKVDGGQVNQEDLKSIHLIINYSHIY